MKNKGNRPFLSLWLAWKYLQFGGKDKNISFMMRICFLGILIGTFALMLTLIITNGFEKVIHEKMQGIASDAIVYVPGRLLDDKSIKQVISEEFNQEIEAASSSSTRQVIVDHNKQQSVLFLKGIEPKTEGAVSSVANKITLPLGENGKLENILLEDGPPTNGIIVGHKVAQQFNLSIGSNLTLLIPEPGSRKKIFLKKKAAIVKGIFNVGFDEYDSKLAYCSLPFLQKLFGEKGKKKTGVDQIALALKEETEPPLWKKIIRLFSWGTSREDQILSKLRKRLVGLNVSSWKELYPAIVSSLKLEKYVMFFILALITLVACMNMISLLFMQIQQKRRDIAILKAMGMPYINIKRLFMSIGLSITFFASVLGLGLAACAGFLLERYPFIELPDVYYVSYLPARMDLEIFTVVFLSTMLLGFLATWIPTKRTKKINIVDVLRQE